MKIELVRVNGMLVGRTFSDRWNLAQLGIMYIPDTRNQAELKKIRRKEADFTFSMAKGQMQEITNAEFDAFESPEQLLAVA